MERLLVHKETWVLCASMVRKDVACPRMQLFEADNEMTAITWESSQERFRRLLGLSREEECWEGLFSIDLWANCWRILFPVSLGLAFSSLYPTVSSPVWPSSHSSSCANMLCLQGSWWFSELLQVPWGLLLLEWQPWLKVFSQIPAGGWTILRPASGSCGSSEPIQAPQFH